MYERRRVLYAACGDLVSDVAVLATSECGPVRDRWGLCVVGDEGVHGPDGGACRRRGGASWPCRVRVLFDLHSVFFARHILVEMARDVFFQ